MNDLEELINELKESGELVARMKIVCFIIVVAYFIGIIIYILNL